MDGRPPLPDGLGASPFGAAVSPSRSWTATVVLFACVVVHALAFGLIVPRSADVYESVDIQLPQVTVVLLGASRGFVSGWLPWTMLMLLGAWHLGSREGAATGVAVASMLLWGMVVIALFLPLCGTMQGIGKG